MITMDEKSPREFVESLQEQDRDNMESMLETMLDVIPEVNLLQISQQAAIMSMKAVMVFAYISCRINTHGPHKMAVRHARTIARRAGRTLGMTKPRIY